MKSSLPIVCLAAMTLAGCGSDSDVSTDAILSDLSPEMRGMVETKERTNAHVHITSDFDSRMFTDDIGRALYTDQPSRLSPYPSGAVTGLPR
ncbi:MAG: hypothetical protein ACYTJ0_04015 [Planctomycetota bacterium]|jgi:hypothetical protein